MSLLTSLLEGADQPLDSDLTALADNAVNGIWARTGAGTGAARDITGTSSEISVTNGDGVSGDPTIGISDNPVLPGTGAVQVPSGTTAQRPSGTAGEFRYNSTTAEFEGYTSSWGAIGGGGGAYTSLDAIDDIYGLGDF
jgi:hypothetical protein